LHGGSAARELLLRWLQTSAGSSALTSVWLCNQRPAQAPGQEPNAFDLKQMHHRTSHRSGRQRTCNPSAEHTAREQDLGVTLGRFIFNNLFTHVCKPDPV